MKQVFPVAEDIKTRLKAKYKEIEQKRQVEEVHSRNTLTLCLLIDSSFRCDTINLG